MTTGSTFPSTGFLGGPPSALPAGQIAVTQISAGSPAEEAGLDTGDILVAMDGDRVDPATFTARLREKPIGSTIELSVLRRDQLRTFPVRVGREEPVTYSIQEKKSATDDQKRILSSWLGGR
jgi:predicted metalloprotease with PDZ domain